MEDLPGIRTVWQQPTPGSHQSIGGAERLRETVGNQLRTLTSSAQRHANYLSEPRPRLFTWA
eukprot:9699587-Alexandrium_andersonii.AAC.1